MCTLLIRGWGLGISAFKEQRIYNLGAKLKSLWGEQVVVLCLGTCTPGRGWVCGGGVLRRLSSLCTLTCTKAQGKSPMNSGSLVEGAAGLALFQLMSTSTFEALRALLVVIGVSRLLEPRAHSSSCTDLPLKGGDLWGSVLSPLASLPTHSHSTISSIHMTSSGIGVLVAPTPRIDPCWEPQTPPSSCPCDVRYGCSVDTS